MDKNEIIEFRKFNRSIQNYARLIIIAFFIYPILSIWFTPYLLQILLISVLQLSSINIFFKSNRMYQQTEIKDFEQYGIFHLCSSILFSIIVLYFLRAYVMEFGSYDLWLNSPLTDFTFQNYKTFILNYYERYLEECFYLFSTEIVLGVGICAAFLAGVCLYILNSISLSRIYNRFTLLNRDREDTKKAFYVLFMYFVLIFFSLLLTTFVYFLEIRGLIEFSAFFKYVIGTASFTMVFACQLNFITKKMNKNDINPEFSSFLTRKLYKFDKSVILTDKAIRFTPNFTEEPYYEKKGLHPIIAIFCFPLALLHLYGLSSKIYAIFNEFDYYASNYDYIFSTFIVLAITLILFVLGIISLKYFKIERTADEIIFQKRFTKDHIPLEIINEVIIDYDIIQKSADDYRDMAYLSSSVKLHIKIILCIPNHTIMITKDIKMRFFHNDRENFESKLIEVLTETLFILGYTTNEESEEDS